MVFNQEIATKTADVQLTPDSVPGITSPSANPAHINSSNFLTGDRMARGRIQRFIHGDAGLHVGSASAPGNLELVTQGNWTRTIWQQEEINISGNYEAEYDSAVVSTFDLPGAGQFTFFGNVRRFFLSGLSNTTSEPVDEVVGTSNGNSTESQVTVRFGNDDIKVHVGASGADRTIVNYGKTSKSQTGSTVATTVAGTNLTSTIGLHFIELWQDPGDDPLPHVEQLQTDSIAISTEGLAHIDSNYRAKAIPVGGSHVPPGMNLGNDLSQLKVEKPPTFNENALIKILITGLLNINIKSTAELNLSTMRTAMGYIGASVRGVDSFTNGFTAAYDAMKATVKALHSRLSALDLRTGLRIGPLRIPTVDADLAVGNAVSLRDLAKAAVAPLEEDAANLGSAVQITDDLASSSAARIAPAATKLGTAAQALTDAEQALADTQQQLRNVHANPGATPEQIYDAAAELARAEAAADDALAKAATAEADAQAALDRLAADRDAAGENRQALAQAELALALAKGQVERAQQILGQARAAAGSPESRGLPIVAGSGAIVPATDKGQSGPNPPPLPSIGNDEG